MHASCLSFADDNDSSFNFNYCSPIFLVVSAFALLCRSCTFLLTYYTCTFCSSYISLPRSYIQYAPRARPTKSVSCFIATTTYCMRLRAVIIIRGYLIPMLTVLFYGLQVSAIAVPRLDRSTGETKARRGGVLLFSHRTATSEYSFFANLKFRPAGRLCLHPTRLALIVGAFSSDELSVRFNSDAPVRRRSKNIPTRDITSEYKLERRHRS